MKEISASIVILAGAIICNGALNTARGDYSAMGLVISLILGVVGFGLLISSWIKKTD